MAELGYSYKPSENEKIAKAQMHDINASYKDLSEVCRSIRGKATKEAVKLLEKVEKGEMPILFKKFNKRLGHRRELGGRKGRYPKKSAKIVMQVLRNAIANAQRNGFSENLLVKHASANKQNIYPRLASKGRQMRSNLETAKVEIVLQEVG
jgi:large subunit ribosomal protein L22